MASLIGKSLGRYQIVEQLGAGGMATVYKAFDTSLERYVAIKVIRTDQVDEPQFIARFQREARALAQLSHPNIVKVLDYGNFEGSPFLVMEYLPGGTLKELLKKSPVSWSKGAQLLAPIARALEYAHQQNIIHRDVKPANFLITQNGLPMLSDFGIAKIVGGSGEQITGTGVGIGTPEYMSPEQAMGRGVDARSDIYSLGIVFYEMSTGRRPFEADTPIAVVVKQINDPLPPPRSFISTLPDAVEQVLLKALAKDPDHRFQNMGQFATALEKIASIIPERPEQGLGDLDTFLATTGIPVSQEKKEQKAQVKIGNRKKWIFLSVILLVIGACCLTLWLLYIAGVCLPAGPWPSFPWCNTDIPAGYNRVICPPPGNWPLPPWCTL
jgi:serine/threonine protein kinase